MPNEEWSDEEFLGYVEIHSRTERALFSGAHVLRFLKLAQVDLNNYNVPPPDGFISMPAYNVLEELRRAKRFVKSPGQLELPFMAADVHP